MTTQALSLSLWPRLKRLDRAWLATALVLAALAVLDEFELRSMNNLTVARGTHDPSLARPLN